VADLGEAPGQNVGEPATEKGRALERDEFARLGTEGHPSLVHREQAVVRDRHAVRVLSQVLDHLFSAAERALAVDVPALAVQAGDERSKTSGVVDAQLGSACGTAEWRLRKPKGVPMAQSRF
jgi:hypothetical protein